MCIHKRNTSSLLSLHSYRYLRPPLRPPHKNTFAQQNADPKTKFQSPYWNPVSDQAKSFIQHLVALDRPSTLEDVLRYPWLTTSTTTIDAPFHTLTLRQNWSSRAKCVEYSRTLVSKLSHVDEHSRRAL